MIQRTFLKREFDNLRDFGGHVWSDLLFDRCRFSGCSTFSDLPTCRSVGRNLEFRHCEVGKSFVEGSVFEDCIVDRMRTCGGEFFIKGCAYRHVTFKGRCGSVIFTGRIGGKFDESPVQTAQRQATISAANAEFYRGVDWALDICDAEFEYCDVHGVPARLVRRDPETQVIVTRSKALSTTWEKLDLDGTHWPTSIKLLLAFGDADMVLVAPKRSRNFRTLLTGLQILRREGIAESD